MLARAEREMLVSYNAADRAIAPNIASKEVNYFQPDEITAILQALETEPLKWRTITRLLSVTGCRRGEIMGLKWSKVDWENHRIKIDNNLLYSKEYGIYEGNRKHPLYQTANRNDEAVAAIPRSTKKAASVKWRPLAES